MPKQEPIELPDTSAEMRLAFEDCDYGTAQLLQIFSCGKTTLFTEILPQLETYLEGTRVKATGRSVKAYRDRKLAEPRRMSAKGSQGSEQLRKSRSRRHLKDTA